MNNKPYKCLWCGRNLGGIGPHNCKGTFRKRNLLFLDESGNYYGNPKAFDMYNTERKKLMGTQKDYRNMSKSEHKIRHIELHKCLDELVADWINITGGSLSETILDFIMWSYKQTIDPNEPNRGK